MLNVGHLQPKMVTAPTHAAPHVYGALPKHSQQGQLAIFDPKKAMEGLKHNPTKAELMGKYIEQLITSIALFFAIE
jgi:hypothetical protein